MTSTRRAITAVLLAVGATAIAAPVAQADTSGNTISPTATLDAVSTMAIPAAQRDKVPHTAEQIQGLNQLNKLSELHQVTDLVAPVTNLVGA
ncbi:hypothetical protein OKJ48_13575 [Streptomyces kunmingensis]|uniref:Secreted protein n=1 Tax=Streptomyces kunmingensis TaxID=68225 RepID=A0ABU6C965_9ACTN|nr:hypothetical protein [Streptomyces kunmingensis]MEB3961269.1 hypothetical protein [Streptomyces kunmingensis]